MNKTEAKLNILFCIICVIKLTQCKVAYRRDDGVGTNVGEPKLLSDAPGSTEVQISDVEKDGPNDTEVQEPDKKQDVTPDTPADVPGSDKEHDATIEEVSAAPDAPPNVPGSDKEHDGADEVASDPSGTLPGSDKEHDDANKEVPEVPDAPPSINEVPVSDKEQDGGSIPDSEPNSSKSCWIPLKGNEHFQKMSNLEQKYKEVRESHARDVDTSRFDKRMLEAMARTRAVAERAVQNFGGNTSVIPAGLNLGSNCLVRMPGSILFFYRLKLRNDTRFVVNFFHNEVEQLTLTLRLSLNDLHLVGEYERALTSKDDPSRLYYRPNKGAVEFLLRDVKYKVEGRYRLLGDRLHIEHIVSEIPPMEILMRYSTDPVGKSTPIDPESLKDYLQRMKNDLDHWLKDYFNDFLMLYGVEEAKNNEKIQEYENERTILLNQYADQVIDSLDKRLRELGAANLIMPDFLLTAANGMEIKLYDGAVRSMDTMYRRSVTTGKLAGKVRYVDTDIGFSGLKVEYRYETYVKTGLPPLSGMLVLNANDVTARLALQVVGQAPSTEDLRITLLKYGQPETLTVEGPANRVIANFQHLLEHHIISIMSSTLTHHIRSLSSLANCDPSLPGKDDPQNRANPSDSDARPTTENYQNDDATTPMKPQESDDELPKDESGGDNDDGGGDGDGHDNTKDIDKGGDNDKGGSDGDDNDKSNKVEGGGYDDDGGGNGNGDHDGDLNITIKNSDADDGDDNSNGNKKLGDGDNGESDGVDIDKLKADEQNQPLKDNESADTNGKNPDYAFVRKESIELELPPKPGSVDGEKLKLDHNETFTLTKINKEGGLQKLALKGRSKNRGKVVELAVNDRR